MKKLLTLILALILCVSTLAACGTSGTGQQPAEDPDTQTQDADEEPDPKRFDAANVTIGRRDRKYRTYTYRKREVDRWFYYYIPKNADASSPMPLVITLHGSGSSASFQIGDAEWVRLAEQEGFIIISPEAVGIDTKGELHADGTPLAKLGRDFSYLRFIASETDPGVAYRIDDVSFLNDLVDMFCETGLVDADRVYLNGFSHGGFLTLRMAAEHPEKFAGFAAVSALVLDEYKDVVPSGGRKVVMINGTADPVVPYDGMTYDFNADGEKEYTWAISAEESVRYFADAYGLSSEPSVTELPDENAFDETTTTRRAYSDADGRERVVLYVVENGGHCWPGGTQYSSIESIGRASRDFRAAEIIWAEMAGETR